MGVDISKDLIDLLKIAAIVFALFHFLAGVILVRQVSRMIKIIHTPNSGCFYLISLIYLIILVLVLVFIIQAVSFITGVNYFVTVQYVRYNKQHYQERNAPALQKIGKGARYGDQNGKEKGDAPGGRQLTQRTV